MAEIIIGLRLSRQSLEHLGRHQEDVIQQALAANPAGLDAFKRFMGNLLASPEDFFEIFQESASFGETVIGAIRVPHAQAIDSPACFSERLCSETAAHLGQVRIPMMLKSSPNLKSSKIDPL